jgi:hypothetical protein
VAEDRDLLVSGDVRNARNLEFFASRREECLRFFPTHHFAHEF